MIALAPTVSAFCFSSLDASLYMISSFLLYESERPPKKSVNEAAKSEKIFVPITMFEHITSDRATFYIVGSGDHKCAFHNCILFECLFHYLSIIGLAFDSFVCEQLVIRIDSSANKIDVTFFIVII